ncbi:hypothetical protein MtrunA17_Chr5g0438691 [Medicago truncatula]|uniref:Transmembrane protein, putative n=1 Tax=Medicago truncatula TaxID=3880 RepID=G7K7H2_MEDTR|nr:transmembrane protein, putative [Medicago truncatula]RHN57283.1 hypothetical protein MtrunA17_Chr5g0438691 [Medicago truncatula]
MQQVATWDPHTNTLSFMTISPLSSVRLSSFTASALLSLSLSSFTLSPTPATTTSGLCHHDSRPPPLVAISAALLLSIQICLFFPIPSSLSLL